MYTDIESIKNYKTVSNQVFDVALKNNNRSVVLTTINRNSFDTTQLSCFLAGWSLSNLSGDVIVFNHNLAGFDDEETCLDVALKNIGMYSNGIIEKKSRFFHIRDTDPYYEQLLIKYRTKRKGKKLDTIIINEPLSINYSDFWELDDLVERCHDLAKAYRCNVILLNMSDDCACVTVEDLSDTFSEKSIELADEEKAYEYDDILCLVKDGKGDAETYNRSETLRKRGGWEGMFLVGLHELRGIGCIKNVATGYGLIRSSIQINDEVEPLKTLYTICSDQDSPFYNEELCETFLLRAAVLNDKYSMEKLAAIYEKKPKFGYEAISWYMRVSDMYHDHVSLYKAACCAMEMESNTLGWSLMKQASELGNPDASRIYGRALAGKIETNGVVSIDRRKALAVLSSIDTGGSIAEILGDTMEYLSVLNES